ncbi:MAG: hypothetical protein ACRCUY_02915 [Thermoguttaceae bacterium]
MNTSGVRGHGTPRGSGTWNASGFRNESRRFPARRKTELEMRCCVYLFTNCQTENTKNP